MIQFANRFKSMSILTYVTPQAWLSYIEKLKRAMLRVLFLFCET